MLAKGDLGDESGRKDEIKDKERGAVPAANQAGYNIFNFQTTTSKQRLQGVERQVAFRSIFWALTIAVVEVKIAYLLIDQLTNTLQKNH